MSIRSILFLIIFFIILTGVFLVCKNGEPGEDSVSALDCPESSDLSIQISPVNPKVGDLVSFWVEFQEYEVQQWNWLIVEDTQKSNDSLAKFSFSEDREYTVELSIDTCAAFRLYRNFLVKSSPPIEPQVPPRSRPRSRPRPDISINRPSLKKVILETQNKSSEARFEALRDFVEKHLCGSFDAANSELIWNGARIESWYSFEVKFGLPTELNITNVSERIIEFDSGEKCIKKIEVKIEIEQNNSI